MSAPLLHAAAARFARPANAFVTPSIDWEFHPGQSWAVVGPTGVGKTTLLEAAAGGHRLLSGHFTRDRARRALVVGFREDGWRFSPARHYYQQRFHAVEAHDDITVGAFLTADTGATPGEADEAASRVGLDGRLDQSLITLSNGQTRRARLARALLARPGLLLLDEPFVGLDAAGREDIGQILANVAADGVALAFSAAEGHVPDWVTHVLVMRESGTRTAPRSEYAPPEEPAADTPPPRVEPGEPVLELRNLRVVAPSGRALLDGIDWTVRRGERWALVGPNGSGKSTLLSVVYADHPAAYGNDVRLFGRRRGDGQTIWQVKSRVGFVSPEFHVYFNEPIDVAAAVGTGFADVVAARPLTGEQASAVAGLLAEFGVSEWAGRPFRTLSTGQQRLALVLRALVKRPELLILDEPFQSLDGPTIRRLRRWLAERLTPAQALVFVTHHPAEVPAGTGGLLELSGGRVARRASPG